MPSAPVLTLRQLNRATLARQLLLERERCTPLDAVERLVGLQAQVARPPFVGLWSRVHGFQRAQLLELITSRHVVRATMMRATLHLASARDLMRFRATLQPVLVGAMTRILGDRTAGLDVERLVEVARELLEERPRAFDELRALFAARDLCDDERAMGYAVRMLLPLVQVPSADAVWGYDAKAAFAVAEAWLGTPLHLDAAPGALALRYLAAFGPATPTDAGVWCGLRGMRELFDELRPELRVFRDQRGRELFDLPDAPRPDGDVAAPVRFLPEFDNLVLSHDDRTRVVAPEHRSRIVSRNLQVAATFLVDGFVAGTWRVTRQRGSAILALQPFGKLPTAAQHALRAEGLQLLRFAEPGARGYEITFAGIE